MKLTNSTLDGSSYTYNLVITYWSELIKGYGLEDSSKLVVHSAVLSARLWPLNLKLIQLQSLILLAMDLHSSSMDGLLNNKDIGQIICECFHHLWQWGWSFNCIGELWFYTWDRPWMHSSWEITCKWCMSEAFSLTHLLFYLLKERGQFLDQFLPLRGWCL